MKNRKIRLFAAIVVAVFSVQNLTHAQENNSNGLQGAPHAQIIDFCKNVAIGLVSLIPFVGLTSCSKEIPIAQGGTLDNTTFYLKVIDSNNPGSRKTYMLKYLEIKSSAVSFVDSDTLIDKTYYLPSVPDPENEYKIETFDTGGRMLFWNSLVQDATIYYGGSYSYWTRKFIHPDSLIFPVGTKYSNQDFQVRIDIVEGLGNVGYRFFEGKPIAVSVKETASAEKKFSICNRYRGSDIGDACAAATEYDYRLNVEIELVVDLKDFK